MIGMKKLNKKGFTLIELLAVIAILAILMLLVTPNILEMFTKGRKDAFVTNAQSVWKAAEQQYLNDSISAAGAGVGGPYCSDKFKPTGVTCKTISTIASAYDYYIDFKADGNIHNFILVDSNFQIATVDKNIDLKADVQNRDASLTKVTCTDGTCSLSK